MKESRKKIHLDLFQFCWRWILLYAGGQYYRMTGHKPDRKKTQSNVLSFPSSRCMQHRRSKDALNEIVEQYSAPSAAMCTWVILLLYNRNAPDSFYIPEYSCFTLLPSTKSSPPPKKKMKSIHELTCPLVGPTGSWRLGEKIFLVTGTLTTSTSCVISVLI